MKLLMENKIEEKVTISSLNYQFVNGKWWHNENDDRYYKYLKFLEYDDYYQVDYVIIDTSSRYLNIKNDHFICFDLKYLIPAYNNMKLLDTTEFKNKMLEKFNTILDNDV